MDKELEKHLPEWYILLRRAIYEQPQSEQARPEAAADNLDQTKQCEVET
ncbi:hypothetical protein HY489_05695 [Candidatus Woesearchaeota archaeon]|nr:hypothetical protein [Candidatus Woesearchaeota archaeon]